MKEMKIVVRIPNWIGDAVLALPALESLRHNFPRASLSIAAKNWVKDLFVHNSLGADVIPLPDNNDAKTIWTTAQALKARKFDIGFLLTNSFSSAFLFYLARIPKRWGYATDGRAVLLTKSVASKPDGSSRHQVQYYLGLLRRLGLETIEPRLKIPVPPGSAEAARDRLIALGLGQNNKPLVIMSPGASYGPAKRWPAPFFGRLAALLEEKKGAEVLIVGSGEEAEIAATIRSSMARKPAILTGTTTLSELLGLISQATLFISNDTGPMHIANGLGVPVVAIFGPTDPAVTGPFQKPSAYIKKEVPCWPCFYRECPYDHRCMTGISPEDVLGACEGLWP
ncbi:MAG: lipopolysaccharide heptosyltransferase II [Candidatus Aminicenantes bacterium]|nr:lipopolysaccharide heptosyltransferase II [Candidatus Aminicenantes bacterium]